MARFWIELLIYVRIAVVLLFGRGQFCAVGYVVKRNARARTRTHMSNVFVCVWLCNKRIETNADRFSIAIEWFKVELGL